jgi:hypothetical protein
MYVDTNQDFKTAEVRNRNNGLHFDRHFVDTP